jgi:flagellar basal-body rod modification protein FlgD
MPTSPIATSSAATPSSTAPPAAPGTLGKDGFLKVLAAQLSQQDPMAAGQGPDVMAQMTQLGILEQLTNLAASQQRAEDDALAAHQIALLGKTVTYRAADGTTASGVVEHVQGTGAKTTLTVAGVAGISPGAVTGVA